MTSTRLALFGTVTSVSALAALEVWRETERDRLRALSLELRWRGYVHVRGSSEEAKLEAWRQYLPQLLQTWKKASSDKFVLSDVATWPCPANGRAHTYTHKAAADYPIRVWDDHYEAQARFCCTIVVVPVENTNELTTPLSIIFMWMYSRRSQ